MERNALKSRPQCKPMVFERTDNGCIVCTSHKTKPDGYLLKKWTVDGKTVQENFHRFVWRAHFGEIEPGHEVDHKCRNKSCCNIDHLQVLSKSDHMSKTRDESSRHDRDAALNYWRHTGCSYRELSDALDIPISTSFSWVALWKDGKDISGSCKRNY